MANAVIIVLLGIAVVAAVVVARRRARQGSACCGTREAAPARLQVADRDKAHYPYVTTYEVGGMTCENCAIRVENALNGMPGTWATVSIARHEACVRTKSEPDEAALRAAVVSAGYVLK